MTDPAAVASTTGAVAAALDLDLTQGPMSELLGQATSIALKMFVVFALLALIIEAFGSGPGDRRDYSGLAWRAVVVLLLLKFYAPIFGTVINTTQAIAAEFKPMEANQQLSRETALYFDAAWKADPATGVSSSSWLGTKVYETSIHLIITLGQAVFWALGILTRIALLLFYVIGPLALVASLPRASRVGARWFGQYVGVACWPIFSALIVRIVLAIGISGMYSSSAFGHVCVALALGLCSLAVPVIASALVGGSVTTATQHGFKVAHSHAASLASTAAAAVRHGRDPERGPGSGGEGHGERSRPSRIRARGIPPPRNEPPAPGAAT